MVKENKKLIAIVSIITLILGVIIGSYAFPITKEVIKEVQVKATCPINEPIVVQNNVTQLVEINYLEKATSTFMQAVDDGEDEAGNDVDILGDYNFDEVSVQKVYTDYTIVKDKDKVTVDFKIKLRFKEADEKSESTTYTVTVVYEDDEDTVVQVI